MKKKVAFATANTFIEDNPNLANLLYLRGELDRINAILTKFQPDFIRYCHCGAIDYDKDTIVLYCKSNAVFHKLHNQIPKLQSYLESSGIKFNQVLIKVKPDHYSSRRAKKSPFTQREYAMMQKFAAAINRPDLVKPLPDENLAEDDDDFEIKL